MEVLQKLGDKELQDLLDDMPEGNVITNELIYGSITEYSYTSIDPQPSCFDGTAKFRDGKIREATFYKFEESEEVRATDIFLHAFMLSDKNILKPWFVTQCTTHKFWLVCYERFHNSLDEWLRLERNVDTKKPMVKNNDVLNPWWCDLIQTLTKTIRYIHNSGFCHGDLSNIKNYVVVSNTVVKIVNVGGRLDKQSLNAENEKINDLRAFGDMLRKQLQTNETSFHSEDQELFLSIFYQSLPVLGYEIFVEKIFAHPFLLTPKQRLKYFFDIDQAAKDKDFMYFYMGSLDFSYYTDWEERATSNYILKKSLAYQDATYDCRSVRDLIRLLRNVYTHGWEWRMDREEVDKHVRTKFPGFLSLLHEIFYTKERLWKR